MNPEISVVVAIMDEEENIAPLISAIRTSLHSIPYEVIFVDDGSKDRTIEEIHKNGGSDVKVIEFMKNFGQSTAMQAGIDAAQGNYIVTIDGDLQNDPSDIPMMYDLIKNGSWDLVAGERKNRKDGLFIRKIPSRIANRLIRNLTGVRIKDYGCTLKIFKHEVAKNLNLYGELHRFIPVLAALQGARIHQVEVKHHARLHGNSKYNLNRTFKVISDLMLMAFFRKYLQKPMHLFGTLGAIIFMIGVLINGYFLILKLMGNDIWGKPMLLLGILLLLAGIQLITIGIVVELQMRTYYESQDKKTYTIRKIHTFEPGN
ncbi:MAG: glycosyltransferase family 2 protein [Flavobacteriales bacterium]|nr:glycosyltransferase family 2 protein [Bacteroidota bacterium]MCB9241740.1 glycosyltransferase family 2 protein [Flavobacteriales bacterium]